MKSGNLSRQIEEQIANASSVAAQVIKEAAAAAAKVLADANAVNNTSMALMGSDIARIKEDMKEIKEIAKGAVSIHDYAEHLKQDEDHERRLRLLEAAKDELNLVKKLVFGCVALMLTAVIGSLIYLVLK